MKSLVLGICILLSFSVSAQQQADDIVGVWKNGEGTAMIKIAKVTGDKYQGKIVWLKEPNDPETGKPKLDKNHPEEAKRSRPVLGLTNVWNFTYANEEWANGFIYDPKNGKTYDCVITLKDKNSMNVRGFIMGMTMFGRTDTWTRQVAK